MDPNYWHPADRQVHKNMDLKRRQIFRVTLRGELMVHNSYTRKMTALVRVHPPEGSTAALAHQEKVDALVALERASHPAIFLLPFIAALLQILGLL